MRTRKGVSLRITSPHHTPALGGGETWPRHGVETACRVPGRLERLNEVDIETVDENWDRIGLVYEMKVTAVHSYHYLIKPSIIRKMSNKHRGDRQFIQWTIDDDNEKAVL